MGGEPRYWICRSGRCRKSWRYCHREACCVLRMSEHTHDAVIIGAGPAGSAAAAVLAEHGRRALVLERERFPRYHIGESLLPFTFQPLQRMGLIEKMKGSAFVKKYSVQFVSPSGKASQPFYFFDRYDQKNKTVSKPTRWAKRTVRCI